MTLDIGAACPEFSLSLDEGSTLTQSALKGTKTVFYFYPKDDTPGCTQESIEFNGLYKNFQKLGYQIYGISPDSVKSHEKFKTKHCFVFPLISDPETQLCQAFGCWKEKSMYGKTYMGVERSTFILDEKLQIKKVWRKVKAEGHAAEVLEAIKELND